MNLFILRKKSYWSLEGSIIQTKIETTRSSIITAVYTRSIKIVISIFALLMEELSTQQQPDARVTMDPASI